MRPVRVVALLLGAAAVSACGIVDSRTATPTRPSAAPPAESAPPTATPAPTPAPTPAAFEDVLKQVRSGVVRFEVTGCDSSGVGSGFLVEPDLLVTVAHVVEDGEVVRVVQGTTSTAARVIGKDAPADVALLRTVAPLDGHLFTFSEQEPEVTDRLAVLGFPDAAPLTITQGTVNGLDRKVVIDGLARHSLIEHDAASTGGSSGGPVVNVKGEIIGLHDAGPSSREGGNLAVSGRLAHERVLAWQDAPEEIPAAQCEQATGPEGAPVPEKGIDPATARHVASTLRVYFAAINRGDFTTAFAQRVASGMDFETFRDAVRSSQDSDFAILDARRKGEEVVVGLSFVSQQEAGAGPAERPGETCTRWVLDYRFQKTNGLWLIAGSGARDDRPSSTPCQQAGTQADPGSAPAGEPSEAPAG